MTFIYIFFLCGCVLYVNTVLQYFQLFYAIKCVYINIYTHINVDVYNTIDINISICYRYILIFIFKMINLFYKFVYL